MKKKPYSCKNWLKAGFVLLVIGIVMGIFEDTLYPEISAQAAVQQAEDTSAAHMQMRGLRHAKNLYSDFAQVFLIAGFFVSCTGVLDVVLGKMKEKGKET